MVAKTLLPQAFWFRFAAPCMRVDGIPRANFSSGLLALPPSCALPDLKPLDGGARWAEVRVGWNSGGLGIAVLADGVTAQQLADRRPEGFAVAQFWVDTRDTRNVSRATKFCHRFVARIDRGSSRGRLDAQVAQRAISRSCRCTHRQGRRHPRAGRAQPHELAPRTVPVEPGIERL